MLDFTNQALTDLHAARDNVANQLMQNPLYRAMVSIEDLIVSLSGVASRKSNDAPELKPVGLQDDAAETKTFNRSSGQTAAAHAFLNYPSASLVKNSAAVRNAVGIALQSEPAPNAAIGGVGAWSEDTFTQGEQGGECRLSAIRQMR